MAWVEYNPNPRQTRRGKPRRVGDCVVRALSAALGISWEEAYCRLCVQGFCDGDMPSSDSVWGHLLQNAGFRRIRLPDLCPECYSVAEFAADNPHGIFVIGTGQHAVAVLDGDYFDAWDSGDEIPAFIWEKGG